MVVGHASALFLHADPILDPRVEHRPSELTGKHFASGFVDRWLVPIDGPL